MLTNHPSLGSNYLLIELIDGLGERLVQGEVTPRQYTIHKNPIKRNLIPCEINEKDKPRKIFKFVRPMTFNDFKKEVSYFPFT